MIRPSSCEAFSEALVYVRLGPVLVEHDQRDAVGEGRSACSLCYFAVPSPAIGIDEPSDDGHRLLTRI